MKLSPLALFALGIGSVDGEDHSSCTHGRLFLADASNSNIYALDLDEMTMINSATVTVPNQDGAPQILEATGPSASFAAINRGTAANRYMDGSINFYSSGLTFEFHVDHWDILKGNPQRFSGASFNCARPTHFVPHDGKIAVFCDGFFSTTASQQVNTTVCVVGETALPTSFSQIHKVTLKGSHHGVAMPVDDDHVMYSVATQERINRVEGTSSLPDGFEVRDYRGNLIHNLNVAGNPARSCKGYHGSAAVSNTFALACDDIHNGILVVDYNPSSSSYTSRHVQYPTTILGERTGTFIEHHGTNHVVGNLASPSGGRYLVAFNPKSGITVIQPRHLLDLNGVTQCSFQFEKSQGDHVLVWMPNGKLRIYEYNPWELVAELTVVPGMSECSQASLAAGYAMAVIVEGNKVHAVELTELYHKDSAGPLKVETRTMGFNVNSAVITGVAVEELACEIEAAGGGFVACFPGNSLVTVTQGGIVKDIQLSALRIGDRVQVGINKFEKVYSFGHYKPEVFADFLLIKASSDTELTVSEDHLIFSSTRNAFVKATSLQSGEVLVTGEGNRVTINSIKKIKAQGAYAPFTPSGQLVVNGIMASTYAIPLASDASLKLFGGAFQSSYQWLAHAFEFPHRLACHYTTAFCNKETYTDDGISTWVAAPLHWFEFIFGFENVMVRDTILALAVATFAFFAVIEGFFSSGIAASAVFVVGGALAASRKVKV